ncbi:ABC transporter permease [Amycolatopsis pithecellobii]|uniref:Autoinducer 2 import system permease protein LsrC n=1 Tax=Amycolatopsis pithecellobii TaxID=664692 RepID=A0A6N7Z312_9PSEU|nr:ABC transporter permease [Amycolatopsis pithecellobii]MTD53206.1 ABC transporter permease [Amycolatopsis pithecellobii]
MTDEALEIISVPDDTPALLRTAGAVLGRGSLVVTWALLIGVFAATNGAMFLQAGTFQTIFSSPVHLVFLSLALVVVFVVGEFDLSVSANMGLAGTLTALLSVNHGIDPWLSSLIAIVAAAGVGAINAVLIVLVEVNAIVVTLGMGTLLGGVSLWLTDLNTVQGLTPSFTGAFNGALGGLSHSFYFGLAATVLVAYVLAKTPLGLRMSFVGTNREVARLAGVPVRRIRIGAYVVSGVFCGIAGVVLAASLGGYDPATSQLYLLPAFAAVFLGTAAIQPGRFNALGAVIAIYFLQTGIVGLQLAGVTSWIQDAFYGGSLVLAVTISTLIRRRVRT